MCLKPERVLDRLPKRFECGGVGGLGESAEGGGTVTSRGVEFTRGAFSNIDGDYATDFFAEGLDCNWED